MTSRPPPQSPSRSGPRDRAPPRSGRGPSPRPADVSKPGERAFLAAVVATRAEAGEAAAEAALGSVPREHRFQLRSALDRYWRHYARLGWLVERQGEAPTPELRAVAALVTLHKTEPATAAALVRQGAAEIGRLAGRLTRIRADGLHHPDLPDLVRRECPPDLAAALADAFGDGFEAELAALGRPAPVDLRANTLKADRAGVLAALAAEGVVADPARLAPEGIRAKGRPDVAAMRAFAAGLFEVQDEGSQMVAALVGARPGQQVLDFCAGAGGKTLALAAAMKNRGHLVAADTSARRLGRARLRMKRAGAENAERVHLDGTDDDPFLAAARRRFDRVLVDAPCSGTGAWRRHPEIKWRPVELDRLTALQDAILSRAATTVKPGGRLVYATCSVLPRENDARADAFLAAHPEFVAVPAPEAWRDATGTAWPLPSDAARLSLSPARNDTDGFFAAVFQRSP